MGFGHRVYRAEDPRARVLRRTARELDAPRYEVAEALEKAALAELRERRPDRVLETNVEFWAAIVLDFAEVPAHDVHLDVHLRPHRRLVGAHPRAEADRPADPAVGDLHRPGGAHGRRGRRLAGRVGPVAEPADWFVGRTAIVTGAGSGIGAALSRALVEAGTHVVCADLDLDAASSVASSCTGPGSARAVALDVTDAGRWRPWSRQWRRTQVRWT